MRHPLPIPADAPASQARWATAHVEIVPRHNTAGDLQDLLCTLTAQDGATRLFAVNAGWDGHRCIDEHDPADPPPGHTGVIDGEPTGGGAGTPALLPRTVTTFNGGPLAVAPDLAAPEMRPALEHALRTTAVHAEPPEDDSTGVFRHQDHITVVFAPDQDGGDPVKVRLHDDGTAEVAEWTSHVAGEYDQHTIIVRWTRWQLRDGAFDHGVAFEDLQAWDDDAIRDHAEELFWKAGNELLSNPFLQDEDAWLEDADLTFRHGSQNEFERLLTLFVKTDPDTLATGFGRVVVRSATGDHPAHLDPDEEHPKRLADLVALALREFQPHGYDVEYNDGRRGRRSGYTHSACIIEIEADAPSAHELAGLTRELAAWLAPRVPAEDAARFLPGAQAAPRPRVSGDGRARRYPPGRTVVSAATPRTNR